MSEARTPEQVAAKVVLMNTSLRVVTMSAKKNHNKNINLFLL